MTALVDLERLFWRAVRHDPPPKEVDVAFASTAKLPARDRVAIYRRGYWYRQVDALFDSFPVLARVLGAERLTKLACRYVSANPSSEPMLERLGARLAEFMRAHDEDPVHADIAELEWAQTRSLLAADPRRTLSIADLDLSAFPTTRLVLAPSVVLCRVRLAAFEAVTRATSASISSTDEVATILLWRPKFAVHERILARDEAAALACVAEGRPLAEVVVVFAGGPAPVRRAATCVMRWATDGLVAESIVSSNPDEGASS